MFKRQVLIYFISFISVSNFGVAQVKDCLVKQVSEYESEESLVDLLNLTGLDTFLYIDSDTQRMHYFSGCEHKEYIISTAKKGINIEEGSQCTPWGLHKIDGKIGGGEPLGRVFQSRVPIEKFYWECEESEFCGITSRILRLRGLEPGVNAGPCAHRDDGHSCDTYDRYIYIHGTRHEKKIGTPISIGCILLTNLEVIEFFDLVEDGTFVYLSKPKEGYCVHE